MSDQCRANGEAENIETLKMMLAFSDFSVVGCCQYFLPKGLSDFQTYSLGARGAKDLGRETL